MSDKNCNTGLDDRCRDENGEIRRKRSDTLVGTLRREYGENFAEGFRSDNKAWHGIAGDELELSQRF